MVPYIICGFPGIGKSYFSEHSEPYIVTDSDSSQFPKEGFPENYLTHIDKLVSGGLTDIIMCSTHKDVIKGLLDRGYDINIVTPPKSLKETMLNRYRQRGSTKQFIDLLTNKFNEFVDDIFSNTNNEHVNIVVMNALDRSTLYDIVKYFSMVPFIKCKPSSF